MAQLGFWGLHMARPKSGVTFWDRVYEKSEKSGDCLLFKGHRNEDGYGRIWRDSGLVFVHREVWERDNGPIPQGMCVCHKCDTPNCIEPSHLWLGSHAENMKDRGLKNRQFRAFGNTYSRGKHNNVGSAHGRAKFNEAQVAAIKASLRADPTDANVRRLAAEHGVSRTAIYHIKRGTRWAHVC